jgi:hypothetical protein
MRYVLIVLALLAVSAGTAQAETGTLTTSARYYSDYLTVRATFHVYDTGSCVKDEYGFYSNYECYSYDRNDADLDVRVWRNTSRGWTLIHSEKMFGSSGVAKTTLYYSFDLKAPYCFTGSRKYTRYYKYSVRLFDPLKDRVVAQRMAPFRVWCR